MAISSDLVVSITGNAQGLKKTLGGVTSGMRGFGKIAGKVSVGLKASFAGLAASLAPLMAAFKGFQFLGEASSLAKTQIAAEKKLGAVLKATGNAAGLTADEIKKLAGERQALTNFGDEDTINAAGLLASFKEIKGDAFKGAIPLIQDMSAAMGQDLKASAIQLGKALNDPIAGIGAMSRVGVQFTYQQKEMIKGLVESGQMAKAQAVIMNELKSEFGGTAEAMADPLTQASNAWGDFKEQVGIVFNDIKAAILRAFGFQEFIGQTGSMAKAFRREWLPSIKATLGRVGAAFQNTVAFVGEKWAEWVPTIQSALRKLKEMWNSTIGFLKDTWNDWEPTITEGIENIKQAFSDARDSLGKTFNFENMKAGYAAFAEEFKTTWSPIIVEGIKKALDLVAEMLNGFKKLGDWLDDINHRAALDNLQKQGKFLDYNLAQFKEYIQLHKDLDRELAGIDKVLNSNQLQSFDAIAVPKTKAKDDPFITEMKSFLGNLNKPKPTPGLGGVKRDDFNAGVNSSIEAGSKEAFQKIFAAMGGHKQEKHEKKTADNTEAMTKTLESVERHLERIDRKTGKDITVELSG